VVFSELQGTYLYVIEVLDFDVLLTVDCEAITPKVKYTDWRGINTFFWNFGSNKVSRDSLHEISQLEALHSEELLIENRHQNHETVWY